MKRILVLALMALCLVLTGCSVFDGEYVNITRHRQGINTGRAEAVSANDYEELLEVLEDMVSTGSENGLINISNYDQDLVERNMRQAVMHIKQVYPIGAYAVNDIEYEIGTSSGRPAVALRFTYTHSRMEIQRICRTGYMENAVEMIYQSLVNGDPILVILVEDYEAMDFTQLVQAYAEANPQLVMEVPQVTSATYGTQSSKVVEITFTYQNNRDVLRAMQNQVQTVFDSAALYVSGDSEDRQKYAQLYGFLMERFDYNLETSITPAYSLLRHGVGDSKAFALVYAAMCRQAGLECMVVTGTRNGEARTWNIINDGGHYYHVDLLRSSGQGSFHTYEDSDMGGYVWDYSAYPACEPSYVEPEAVPEPSEP